MLKRRTPGPKAARKRKKGNTTYSIGSLDPPIDDKKAVEHIRVWDVSTSENTGRISANRRTVKHYRSVSPSQLEEPSTSKGPGGNEGGDAEDAGILGDSESLPGMAKKRPKRKSTKAFKENDSVSELQVLPVYFPYSPFQTKMEMWLQSRQVVLDELLRLDGLGDALNSPKLCPVCSNNLAQYRCTDCLGDIIHCSTCILSSHRNLPLHRLQVCQTSRHFDIY